MKKKTPANTSLFLILLIVFSVSVLECGSAVMLESSKPVIEQVAALTSYISQLPKSQQDEWFRMLELVLLDRKTIYSLATQAGDPNTVFITEYGMRYHRNNTCWGLSSAKAISAVTKQVAVEMGRSPCKLCYPNGDL